MEIRKINTELVKENVIELIHKSSFNLPYSAEEKLISMIDNEEKGLAKITLQVIKENISISRKDNLPLCQDCGMVIIFLEVGQEVAFIGDLHASINEGVAEAYKRFNLRKSVVGDPLKRMNTGTNTPSIIHTEIVGGNKVEITVYIKGGGSENMTSLKMFRPTDPVELIIDYIEESVVAAGPNPCPPIFLGVGIGGTADLALLNSKKAVLRGVGSRHSDPYYSDLEMRIEEKLNRTNVGPLGFGGRSTTGGVFIKEAPTHIATLPVALNFNCHSLRYRSCEL